MARAIGKIWHVAGEHERTARKTLRLFIENYEKVKTMAIELGYTPSQVDADVWLARMLDMVAHYKHDPYWVLVTRDFSELGDKALQFEAAVRAIVQHEPFDATRLKIDPDHVAILQQVKLKFQS
jgi:hypothetical protein